jgi:dienelactone hydrolase
MRSPVLLDCLSFLLLSGLAFTQEPSRPTAAPVDSASGEPTARPAVPPAAGGPSDSVRDHGRLDWFEDSAGLVRPIRTVADVERRRTGILAAMERVMGPRPTPAERIPLEVQEVERRRVGELLLVKLSYRVDPTPRRVRAWLIRPEASAGSTRRGAVLCLHQTIGIGKDEPAGLGGSQELHYAAELARRGYVTLAPDYPSFGEHPFDFATEPHRSGSMRAIADNHRAVDLLETLADVDPARIGVVGHSLGGHNALFTAAFDPRLKVVVTSCGFTAFGRYYGGNLTGWTSDRYMPRIRGELMSDPKRMPFDFPEVLAAIAPRAVFISAPTRDDNFDLRGVKESVQAARPIFQRLGADARLKVIHPDAGHGFPESVRREAWSFLDEQLGDSSRGAASR